METPSDVGRAARGVFIAVLLRFDVTRRLVDDFGDRFLLLLTFMYFGVKGLAFQSLVGVTLPYFKGMGIEGALYQVCSAVGTAGWAMKAVLGATSDSFPLLGYHKRYYMVAYCFLSGGGMLLMTVLKKAPQSAPMAAILSFFANLGLAGLDLLCEGKYTEFMAKKPEGGSSIVSWVWFWVSIGGIMAAAFVGPIVDILPANVVLWSSAPLLFLFAIPVLHGWLPEEKQEGGDPRAGAMRLPTSEEEAGAAAPAGTNAAPRVPHSFCPWLLPEMDHRNRNVVMLGVAASTGALGYVIATLLVPLVFALSYVVVFACVLSFASFRVLPAVTAKANLLIFFINALSPQVFGPLNYFYQAPPECVPGGPNFSNTYYITWNGIVSSVAQLAGVFVFHKFLSKMAFRRVFHAAVALTIVAALFDIVLVERWNIALHIDDKVAYLAGDAIIAPVVQMLSFMPSVVLTSKVCPEGMEATTYALLAGFANLGMSVSATTGAMLSDALGIRSTMPCDFRNLSLLIFLCHVLFPCATFVAIHYLAPKKKMTDDFHDLLHEEEDGVIRTPPRHAEVDDALELADAPPVESPEVDL